MFPQMTSGFQGRATTFRRLMTFQSQRSRNSATRKSLNIQSRGESTPQEPDQCAPGAEDSGSFRRAAVQSRKFQSHNKAYANLFRLFGAGADHGSLVISRTPSRFVRLVEFYKKPEGKSDERAQTYRHNDLSDKCDSPR